jgi:membrane protein required for beta-lactamase induction
MIGALLGGLWPYLAGAVIMLAGVFGIYTKGRRDVTRQRDLDAARTTSKQEAKGRDAVAKEKRASDGADNRDLVDRVRGRDGDWGGV